MTIRRIIEVWEKGLEGSLVTHWPVASTVTKAYLFRLFAHEQQVADPDIRLSYFLTLKQVAALQPYVAQEMRTDLYDFVLSTQELAPPVADISDGDEPFD
jgi:hypothetical protein